MSQPALAAGRPAPLRGIALTVLVCGSVMITISMGIRYSYGIFQTAVTEDLGVGREVFGLAVAISHLAFGIAQPIIGAIADKYGYGRTAFGGTIIYVLGMGLAAVGHSPLVLHATLGVLTGIGCAATSYVVVLAAIARVVPPERRGSAFGIATAAGSVGMFLVVPGSQLLLSDHGWRATFWIFAAITALMMALSVGLADRRKPVDQGPEQPMPTARAALAVAGRHSGFWLLTAGFFVCGFHVAFIGTHFPAYLTDMGASPMISANAFALIGFFNILGSFWFGRLSDRYRKKYVLSGLYFSRAVFVALFFLLPFSETSAILFGAAIGFTWLGTIPPTNGLVTQIFGLGNVSMLTGIVYLSHQVGAFIGAWIGGYVFDATGSYDTIWIASIALALVAAVLHWPIRDAPVALVPAR